MSRMFTRISDSRSGISTVLGTLIFVGILFTSVIPLFLYVNRVNSYYEVEVMEMRQFNQEREMERLEVYAYPVGENPTELYVFVKSKCALDQMKVVRVWVNDSLYNETNLTNLPLVLSGVSEGTIQGINISYGYFDVWVTTNRGNVFASFTNTLHVNASGEWEPGTYNFGIHIFITQAGKYNVTVTNDSGFWHHLDGIQAAPTAYRVIAVPEPGMYDVNVTKGTTVYHFDSYVSWTYPHAQVEVPP